MKQTKVLSLSIISLLVIFSVALVVSGAEIEVPSDYESIQDAISAAGPGDTILLAEGTYEESFTITKDNLRIVAAGDAENTVIKGTVTLESVHGIVLEDLTVTGSGDGIRVRGNCRDEEADTLEVIGCSLSGNIGNGIDFSHGAWYRGVVIRDSEISQNGADGINLASTGRDIVIEDNEISDNGRVTATGTGIRLSGGVTDVLIEGNSMFGNAFANIHPQSG